jgi:glycosyltransferase involved in cell wall biosynthesis
MIPLVRKLRSARMRLGAAIDSWQNERAFRAKDKVVTDWVKGLRRDPPDVLIGANFAEYGGVRRHIRALKKYSSLRLELTPPDDVIGLVTPHELVHVFRDSIDAFRPGGIKALHSHVFPWFIEWCSRHRAASKWVHTYHAPYLAENGETLPAWQDQFNRAGTEIARFADTRISVSRWQQDFLRSRHGIETVYIPNGVDVELCDSAEPARSPLRDVGEFVLFVGRNDPVKNPRDFIRAARITPDVVFAMIGRGLAASDEQSLGVNVPSNLRLLGELSHRSTLDTLAAASCIVVTSRREGLPGVVLEALTLGKPVVVPNDPGCVEAVGGNQYGFIYSDGDITDLSQKVETAIASGVQPIRRDRILAEYDWRVVAPQLDRIYTA